MAAPPPNQHICKEKKPIMSIKSVSERWESHQSVKWRKPDNPGAWCCTNHHARNQTMWQILATHRKSPGSFGNPIERSFKHAKAWGCAGHVIIDSLGEKIRTTYARLQPKIDTPGKTTNRMQDLKTVKRHERRSSPLVRCFDNLKRIHMNRSTNPPGKTFRVLFLGLYICIYQAQVPPLIPHHHMAQEHV